MKKYPSVIKLSERWIKSLGECGCSRDGKTYVPARPLGFASLRQRFRCAIMVFRGQADALVWPQGQ